MRVCSLLIVLGKKLIKLVERLNSEHVETTDSCIPNRLYIPTYSLCRDQIDVTPLNSFDERVLSISPPRVRSKRRSGKRRPENINEASLSTSVSATSTSRVSESKCLPLIFCFFCSLFVLPETC